MHTRMLVTMPLEAAKTSLEARQFVDAWLSDEGFTQNGRFACGYGDWYVIGGRWSGCLASYNPDVVRDDIGELGAEDDAMVLAEELYEKHLAQYEGESVGEQYCDVEDEPCGPEMTGKRWVVVVDYRNQVSRTIPSHPLQPS